MRMFAVTWMATVLIATMIDSASAVKPQKEFKSKAEVISAYEDYTYFHPNVVALTEEDAQAFLPVMSSDRMGELDPIEYSRESLDYARMLKSSLSSDRVKAAAKKKNGNGQGNGKGTGKRRKRREANPTGTVTTIRSCMPRGFILDGMVQLSTVCAATTTLPLDRFPRFLNEFVCHGFDLYCLSYEGIATQQYSFIKLRRNPGNLTIEQLHRWTEYDQQLRTGCVCKLSQDSVFMPFV